MAVVLVTGASGFLGRHALTALRSAGHEVHGLSRRPPADDACIWHTADMLDADAIARLMRSLRPSHLLHMAWVMEHGRYWTSPENVRWVEATLHLARQFEAAGGRRFVGAGTCAEYTWDDAILGGRAIDEQRTPRAPDHFYGIAKNAAFELLAAYSRAVGLAFAWGRLFFPYGPDRPTMLIPEIVSALQEGRPALCTHGRQRRDFIHVSDAAAAFAAMLDSEVSGAVNIGTGTATTIADVATRLGHLLGRPELIKLDARAARPGEPQCLVADVGRLRDEVGFVAKIALDDGLRATIASLSGTRDDHRNV